MRFSNLRTMAFAVGVGLLSSFGSASATVISYAASFGPADVATFEAPPAGSAIMVYLPAFDVTQFDVTKLLGISLTLTDSGNASVTVHNFGGTAATSFSQTATIALTVTGPGSLFTSNTLMATNPTPVTVTPSGSSTVSGLPVSASSSTVIPTADWTQFEGSGLVELTFSLTDNGGAFSGTGGAGNLFYGGDAVVSGTVEIDYQMVPEPAALALIGSGLICLAAIRRTRQPGASTL